MKKLIAAAALSLATLCAAPALATTYFGGADFDGSANGSTGVWTYGYIQGGVFTDLTFIPNSGIGFYGRPGAAFDTPLIAPMSGNELLMHPGEQLQDVVLRFTAPTAGSYFASFQAGETDNSCLNCGADGVKMILGAQTADVEHMAAPSLLTETVSLAAGQHIDFTIDPKSNYGWDSTGVFASVTGVPEPAAWALMIAGFGGVGAVLRRQRRAVALAA